MENENNLPQPETPPQSQAVITDVDMTRPSPGWAVRRRIIFTTLIFCALCVVYIIFKGNDTRVYETVVMSAFALAGMVIGSYVFGAVWDDKSRREMSTRAAQTISVPGRR